MKFLSSLLRRAAGNPPARTTGDPPVLDDTTAEANLRRAVRDMRAELNAAVQASAEAMTARNRLETEVRHLRDEAGQWRDRAREALASGDDERARKALARKQESDRRMQSLEPSLESARRNTDALSSRMSRLRVRIEDAERNAAALIARRNAAAAQKRIARAIGGVGDGDDAFAALGALEESVAREEAEAEIDHHMASASADELEREFRALESPGVESELEELRREVNGRIPPASTEEEV